MSVTINASTLLHMSEDELWEYDYDDVTLNIVFEDGTIDATSQSTVFSWYVWELHRKFPKTPLLTRHHIQDTRITKDTHVDCMNIIIQEIKKTYDQLDMDYLSDIAYMITTTMYSRLSERLEGYESSIDILDFIEIYRHPKIAKIREETGEGERDIEDSYNKLNRVLKDPNELYGNCVADSAKSKTTPINQIAQCVHLRGKMADINGQIYRKPIMNNYLVGLCTLYESLVESSSAAKAQLATKKPVQQAEVFNRLMQLLGQSFLGVTNRACSNTEMKDFYLTSHNFSQVLGKTFFDGNVQRYLTEEDTQFVDKVIQIRSINDCQEDYPQHVCMACYGSLYHNLPEHTNLGHTSSTTICRDASQGIISTKHYDGTAIQIVMVISDAYKDFIELGVDKNHILFTDKVASFKEVKFVIDSKEASHLSDINSGNIEQLSVSRVSELSSINLTYVGKSGYDEITLPISIPSRKSSLSTGLLKHIKKTGVELDAKGNYVISLEGWDFDKPAFVLPSKQSSMKDFFVIVESTIKSKAQKKGDAIETLVNIQDPWEATIKIMDIVSERFVINLIHFEAVIYMLTANDPDNLDYRLRQPGSTTNRIVPLDTLMYRRSLGATLSYSQHGVILSDSIEQDLIDAKYRPYHPADCLILGDKLS